MRDRIETTKQTIDALYNIADRLDSLGLVSVGDTVEGAAKSEMKALKKQRSKFRKAISSKLTLGEAIEPFLDKRSSRFAQPTPVNSNMTLGETLAGKLV